MGISYDAANRKWSYTNEKTDYITDYKTDNPTNLPTNLPTNHHNFYTAWANSGEVPDTLRGALRGLYATYLGRYPTETEINTWRTNLVEEGWESGTGIGPTEFNKIETTVITSTERKSILDTYSNNKYLNEYNDESNSMNKIINEKNQIENNKSIVSNRKNAAKNQVYANTLSVVSGTKGGDYVLNRDGILNQSKQLLLSLIHI